MKQQLPPGPDGYRLSEICIEDRGDKEYIVSGHWVKDTPSGGTIGIVYTNTSEVSLAEALQIAEATFCPPLPHVPGQCNVDGCTNERYRNRIFCRDHVHPGTIDQYES
jgi:hypothetical protein